MVVPVETPISSDIEPHILLRTTFLENLNNNKNYDDYEPADIEKVKNDDQYCERFILHKKGNFDDALAMMNDALKWRKSFNVKDVTLQSLPLEFFQLKAVYPYNKDKVGNPIILILVRFHKKNPEFAKELRRFVIYWVELMEEQTNGGQMTVIVSCEGAGISNLDLDLIKFLIILFREYYPHSLAHILVYELPWILNPAWKIIKNWLPEDFVEKIVFVNKTSIQDFISEDNLPVDMGGTDTTEYVPPTEEDINKNIVNGMDKKLENGFRRSSSRDMPGQVIITDDLAIIGGILKISPSTKLVFDSTTNTANDVSIKLSCASDKIVSYKVKTNNINSYRVKPSVGIIEPGNTVEINVVLLSGFTPQPTDKFLIMAMEVSDPKMSGNSLNESWRTSSSDTIADHKLKCVLKSSELSEESDIEKSLKNISLTLNTLENKINSMESKQSSMQLKQNISLTLTIFFVITFLYHLCVNEYLLSNVL